MSWTGICRGKGSRVGRQGRGERVLLQRCDVMHRQSQAIAWLMRGRSTLGAGSKGACSTSRLDKEEAVRMKCLRWAVAAVKVLWHGAAGSCNSLANPIAERDCNVSVCLAALRAFRAAKRSGTSAAGHGMGQTVGQ